MSLSSRSASVPIQPVIHVEPTPADVAEVVALVRSGSRAALATVYRWYSADLLRLITRVLASGSDAEDVVHDLFLGLPEHLARCDDPADLRKWLRATAITMARMRRRRDARRFDLVTRDPDAVPRAQGPFDAALALDLERAVAALPDSLRAVFVLKQWEGFSHDEIALLLDITPGASRVRQTRALEQLRTLLDR